MRTLLITPYISFSCASYSHHGAVIAGQLLTHVQLIASPPTPIIYLITGSLSLWTTFLQFLFLLPFSSGNHKSDLIFWVLSNNIIPS